MKLKDSNFHSFIFILCAHILSFKKGIIAGKSFRCSLFRIGWWITKGIAKELTNRLIGLLIQVSVNIIVKQLSLTLCIQFQFPGLWRLAPNNLSRNIMVINLVKEENEDLCKKITYAFSYLEEKLKIKGWKTQIIICLPC